MDRLLSQRIKYVCYMFCLFRAKQRDFRCKKIMKAPQSIFIGDVREARVRPGRLLWNWLLLILGVLAAEWLFPGISVQGEGSLGQNGWGTLVLAALLLSILNLALKPLLVFFTLPFVVFTFGLGLWIINAVLLWLTGQLVPGFVIDGFSTALWASLVISVVSLIVNLLFRPKRQYTGESILIGIDKNTFVNRSQDSHYDQNS